MPDADDFDVEYFRSLMQKKDASDGEKPAAKKPAAGKKTRSTAKAAPAKGKTKPATARKRGTGR